MEKLTIKRTYTVEYCFFFFYTGQLLLHRRYVSFIINNLIIARCCLSLFLCSNVCCNSFFLLRGVRQRIDPRYFFCCFREAAKYRSLFHHCYQTRYHLDEHRLLHKKEKKIFLLFETTSDPQHTCLNYLVSKLLFSIVLEGLFIVTDSPQGFIGIRFSINTKLLSKNITTN